MRSVLVAVLCAALTGCAFTNRANRPVWNAFEEHVVPEDDTWFALTLPLTVPAGLVTVLTDTLIVHPARVVDDAVADAGELWTDPGPDWDDAYYTEMAALPFRAAGTPAMFLVSFLGRSMFDLTPGDDSHADPERDAETTPKPDPAVTMRDWLRAIASGGDDNYRGEPVETWTAELIAELTQTLERADANGRFWIYHSAVRGRIPEGVLAPTSGLEERDPVVRYRMILTWPKDRDVDPELVRKLKADPVESVRLQAERRWPDESR